MKIKTDDNLSSKIDFLIIVMMNLNNIVKN